MDEARKPESITFFEHEAEVARQERHIKRLSIFCAVIFAAFVFSNLGWIIYESQYQKVQTTVAQDASSEGGGNATIYGEHAGAVINGESEADPAGVILATPAAVETPVNVGTSIIDTVPWLCRCSSVSLRNTGTEAVQIVNGGLIIAFDGLTR